MNDQRQEKSLYINMFQVVEDIDVVTLKKVEKLEWERKHGYDFTILFASIFVCDRKKHIKV